MKKIFRNTVRIQILAVMFVAGIIITARIGSEFVNFNVGDEIENIENEIENFNEEEFSDSPEQTEEMPKEKITEEEIIGEEMPEEKISEYGHFKLIKIAGDTGLFQAGAVFGVYRSDDNEKVCEIVSSETGAVTSSLLPVGDYYVKELECVEGYLLLDETFFCQHIFK